MMKIQLILSGIILFSAVVHTHADDRLWMQVSGSWSIDAQNKVLSDSKARARIAGYTEVHDMNSIQSVANYDKLTRLTTEFSLITPMPENKAMIFFGASTQKSFHALRLTGTMEKITTAAIVRSSVKDTTLPFGAKNNFEVKEVVSSPVSIKWGEAISVEVKAKKKKLSVTVNGKELEYKMDEPLPPGMIGFSHANSIMRVRSVKAYSGDDLLLEDDFSKDRLKKLSYTAEKVKK